MTSLLAARGKHFAATLGLHARAKPVRLGAAAFARLKCALWQNNPPLYLRARGPLSFTRSGQNSALVHAAAGSESSSVCDPCAQGQESEGVAYREGKSETPFLALQGKFAVILFSVIEHLRRMSPGWNSFVKQRQHFSQKRNSRADLRARPQT